jgi:hypothetical protein
LARVAWVELCRFQLDDHVSQLLDVEEQQIDEEGIAVDVEVDLTADEFSQARVVELIQQFDDVASRQLCNGSLHN